MEQEFQLNTYQVKINNETEFIPSSALTIIYSSFLGKYLPIMYTKTNFYKHSLISSLYSPCIATPSCALSGIKICMLLRNTSKYTYCCLASTDDYIYTLYTKINRERGRRREREKKIYKANNFKEYNLIFFALS